MKAIKSALAMMPGFLFTSELLSQV
jgi:hypothetical protein